MRKSLLILALGLFIGVGSANACDGGKTCKTAKGTKASADCMKNGKCTTAAMKSGKCPMNPDGTCSMPAGHCDMKSMKKADKASASAKHSCCVKPQAQKS
jgi:hypothetical protein